MTLTTIAAIALTIYFSCTGYRKGTMSARSFRILCVCEGVALLGSLSQLIS